MDSRRQASDGNQLLVLEGDFMEEIQADLIRHIAEERVRWSGDNRDRQSVNRKRQVDSGDFTSQPRRHCERARFDLASDLSGWGRLLAGRYEIQPRHCTGTCQCKISFRLTTRSPVSEQSTSMSRLSRLHWSNTAKARNRRPLIRLS
jgi:hypothetical protein